MRPGFGIGSAPLPPGGLLPAGTAAGQLLIWDGAAWVAQAEGTADNQMLVWDSAVSDYVPRRPMLCCAYGFGSTSISAANPTYIQVNGGDQASGPLTSTGRFVALVDGILDLATANHGNPAVGGVMTYAIEIEGIGVTLVAVALNSNAAGPVTNAVNSVNINAGQRFFCNVANPSVAAAACRPQFSVRFTERI